MTTEVHVQHLSKVAQSYKNLVDPRSAPMPIPLAVSIAKAVVTLDKALELKRERIEDLLKVDQQEIADELATGSVDLRLPVIDPELLEQHELAVNLEALMVLTYYDLVQH